MERNKLLVILLMVIFLVFCFRVGLKIMGLNILDIMETESSGNTENPPAPQIQVLNRPAGTGTGPAKVGTISINPGVVTTVEIER